MNNKSPHILNAASNLLGFCFIVLTSIKVLKVSEASRIDELTGATMIFLMIAIIFSFFSIRGKKRLWEHIADFCFIIAIISLFITTIVIVFDITK